LAAQQAGEQSALRGISNEFRVPAQFAASLQADSREAYQPYEKDQNVAQRTFREEMIAMDKTNATFFDQARKAVPQLREQGKQITEQYRQGYEEKQAQIRAEAERRAEEQRQISAQLALAERKMALDAQMNAARIAADQQIAAANLSAMRAGAPVYTPSWQPPPPVQRQPATRKSSRRALDMEASRRRER
ncbi:MAG TPA: hypothetical protein VGW38_06015, partial [Chloroflexota bacterium]|nr:hypothetical protein [Chloroflexota bacterium]